MSTESFGAAGLPPSRPTVQEPAGLTAAESAVRRSDSRSRETGRANEELAQLDALAKQFEAVLLGQMLREMRSSMFEENDESGFGGGPLADSVYAELSQQLGKAGGFGLAEAMKEALLRQVETLDKAVSRNEGTAGEPLPATAQAVTALIKGYAGATDYRRAGIGFGESREPEQ